MRKKKKSRHGISIDRPSFLGWFGSPIHLSGGGGGGRVVVVGGGARFSGVQNIL